MPRISHRIDSIAESATMAVTAKAKALRAQGENVIGDPTHWNKMTLLASTLPCDLNGDSVCNYDDLETLETPAEVPAGV